MGHKVRCTFCGFELVSQHRHDFKYCGCGRIAVDGGNDYLKTSGSSEHIEIYSDEHGGFIPLSEFFKESVSLEDEIKDWFALGSIDETNLSWNSVLSDKL